MSYTGWDSEIDWLTFDASLINLNRGAKHTAQTLDHYSWSLISDVSRSIHCPKVYAQLRFVVNYSPWCQSHRSLGVGACLSITSLAYALCYKYRKSRLSFVWAFHSLHNHCETRTQTHLRVHAHTKIGTNKHTDTHTHTHTHTHTRTSACTCAYKHRYKQTHWHTHEYRDWNVPLHCIFSKVVGPEQTFLLIQLTVWQTLWLYRRYHKSGWRLIKWNSELHS